MATQVSFSWNAAPSLGSGIFIEVRDPRDGSILAARSNTGIREDRPSCYAWSRSLTTLQVYEVIVDDGTNIASDIFVPEPTINLTSAPLVLPAGGVSPVVTQSFFIKRGDNEPLIFPVTELNSSGGQVVQDVTGWTGNFKLRATPDAGSIVINHAFYISDPDGVVTTDGSFGLLAYGWPVAGDTDREGLYLAEFECHRSDGTKKTYPTTSDNNNEYIRVQFVPDLDDAGSH